MTVGDEIEGPKKEAIDELRNRMKNEMDPEMYEDIHLFCRFLAARDFNVDNAETMLRKHLEWREEHDIKNIFNFKLPEVIRKYFPYIILGYDKEGCPIRFAQTGNFDFLGLHKSCKFEDIVKFMLYEIELETKELKKQSKRLGKNVDKCIYIFDFKHFSFATITDKKCIYSLIYLLNTLQNNYPEIMKAIYILNASSYFFMALTILKSILPNTIISKFHIYTDESWKEDLLKAIDADVLPAFLGGTKTDPDGNPLCLTFIKHGTPVPKSYYIDRSTKSLAKCEGVKKMTLSRAAFHEIKVDVKEPGSYLEWEFETKCRDIGFGLFYQDLIDGEEKMTEIIAIERIDTTEFSETGAFKCKKAGAYVMLFDNTYSWIRAKEIFYRLKIVTPEEYENQGN